MGCAAFAAPPELPRETSCAIWQEGKLSERPLAVWQPAFPFPSPLPSPLSFTLECFCSQATCECALFWGKGS